MHPSQHSPRAGGAAAKRGPDESLGDPTPLPGQPRSDSAGPVGGGRPLVPEVRRLPLRFGANSRRVISRFFSPGNEERARRVFDRVMALSDDEAAALLAETIANFSDRHRDVDAVFAEHFQDAATLIGWVDPVDDRRRLLIGAYFTMEYSIESAALFNPSIIPAYDQTGVAPGALRVAISLRAVGEGHVSSIVFRRGVVRESGHVEIDTPSVYARRLRTIPDKLYSLADFRQILHHTGALDVHAQAILARLPDQFTMRHLIEAADVVCLAAGDAARPAAESVRWLARSNYHLEIPQGMDPSELVIFPTSENESRGIEDARLVRFVDDDGSIHYYGTYTAYNGFRILPQIFHTTDFRTIGVHTLAGRYAANKGLAMFPRRIDGRYAMISRVDGENLYLMLSDSVRYWDQATRIQTPRYPWEAVQIGNCGSPIETDDGWLLLTHGVGPMRRYCIGATLLDKHDPSRVLGRLSRPLLEPSETERDGYVPNVVYSCGAVVHAGKLIIPYGLSDSATSFATVNLRDLLAALRHSGA